MTGRERIMAALRGTACDRPPVSLTLSLYGAGLIDCPLKEYYTHSGYYAEGQLAVMETIGPDVLFTPFTLASIGKAFGSEVVYFDSAPPNVTVPWTESAKQAAAFEPERVFQHAAIQYLVEAAERLTKNLGDHTAVAGVMLSPVDLPPMLMGMEAWLNTILFEEEEAAIILKKTTQLYWLITDALFSRSIPFLALPMAFCNPRLVTKGLVERLFMPVLEEAFYQTKGPVVLHHAGMPMNPFLPLLKTLPQVIGFVLDPADSFTQARKMAGEGPVLLGNIDGPTLSMNTPENVYLRCANILKKRCGDPHFVLATSGADIPLQTPAANIRGIMQAAHNHGKAMRYEQG